MMYKQRADSLVLHVIRLLYRDEPRRKYTYIVHSTATPTNRAQQELAEGYSQVELAEILSREIRVGLHLELRELQVGYKWADMRLCPRPVR